MLPFGVKPSLSLAVTFDNIEKINANCAVIKTPDAIISEVCVDDFERSISILIRYIIARNYRNNFILGRIFIGRFIIILAYKRTVDYLFGRNSLIRDLML